MLPEIIFYTAVVPIALALFWVVLGIVRGGPSTPRGAVGAALAAASAPFAVQLWIRGLPAFPLTGSASWFFIAVALFGLVAVVLSYAGTRVPTVAAWGLRIIALGTAMRLVLAVPFAQASIGGLLTWTTAVALGWVVLHRTEAKAGGGIFALVLAALAGFTAVVLATASSITLAQVAGASALAALVAAAAAFRHPSLRLGGLTDVLWPTTGLLAWMGVHFADVYLGAIGVVFLVPMLPFVMAHASFKRASLRALANAASIALGFAVAIAVQVDNAPDASAPMAPRVVSEKASIVSDDSDTVARDEEPYDPYAIGGNNDPDYDPYKPR